MRGGDQGAVQRFQVEGRREYTLRTGWISADYAEHLRAVPLGRCWLIDDTQGRFLEVLPAGGTIRLTKDDDDLHAVEFSFTAASPDRGAHNL